MYRSVGWLCFRGSGSVCRSIGWLCVRGSYPLPLMSNGERKNVVGRGVMITRELLVLPSMLKGEIVDQRLSLMSTQAAPGATPILHGNFDLPN